MSGCGEHVQTDPSVLFPVLKQAQRCCDGRCEGMYSSIPENAACGDVAQLESCFSGNKDNCPVKGQGAF